jgi:hypothetical protein
MACTAMPLRPTEAPAHSSLCRSCRYRSVFAEQIIGNLFGVGVNPWPPARFE